MVSASPRISPRATSGSLTTRDTPEFGDKPGRSALIARTSRGYDIVRRAIDAGVIEVTEASADDVAQMQPYQRSRRQLLLGRLVGTRLALGPVPTYKRFNLLRFAMRRPRQILKEFRGTIVRVRDRQKRGFRS